MKERAVRMLIEAKDDYPLTWSAIKAIAPKIGCTPETLRSWHKKHVDKTIPANIQAQSAEHGQHPGASGRRAAGELDGLIQVERAINSAVAGRIAASSPPVWWSPR